MREKPAEELGVDTFYYSVKSGARELCAPLQHQIVTKGKGRRINGVKVYELADYGYGRPEGCLGINCGHYMTPFVVGVNYKPDLPKDLESLDQKKSIENANAEAKQRAFEREIRKSKELINISKIVSDRELEQKHRLRLKTLQGGLKQHIEKYPFLYRDSIRERATKRLINSNNSRLEAKNIGKKVMITDEAIKKVPLVRVPGFEKEDNRNLQMFHKELLRKAKHDNNSNEVSGVYSLINFNGVKHTLGTRDTVVVKGDGAHMLNISSARSLVVIHNHPGQSNFSLADINFFFFNDSVRTMTIVTNYGSVKYINKNENYDKKESGKIFYKFYKKIQEIIKSEPIENRSKKIDKELAKYYKNVKMKDKGIDIF